MKEPRILATGRGLVESVRWHDGKLWFADWSAGEIVSIEPDGALTVQAKVASLPLCFDFLPDGSLLIVSASDAKIVRAMPGGKVERYADLPAGANGRFNEIIIDRQANVYVNGPSLVLVRPDRSVSALADDFAFPNGMAIVRDTLIIAESHGHRLTAFDIGRDGAVSNRRIWADLGAGTPDGISADGRGRLWYADVPHHCCVLVEEGGREVERIALDRGGFSCALGGDNGRTLFVAAASWFGMDRLDDIKGTGCILSFEVAAVGGG